MDAQRGGDFYYASPGEQGRLAVVIGDACGHGAEGAEVLKELLPSVQGLLSGCPGPGKLLTELNLRIADRLPLDRFATALAVTIDPDAGLLMIANAGHVPALLRRATGGVSLIGRASGPPLGLLLSAVYQEERVRIAPGDTLVFMTDGMLEAVEPDLLQMSGLRRTIARAPGGRVHSSVGHMLDGMALARDDRMLLSVELLRGPRARGPSLRELSS